MKSKEEVLKNLFVTLNELQSGTVEGELETYLRNKLNVINDILDSEDIPECYWQQIEDEL
jgi:hypothetical protein